MFFKQFLRAQPIVLSPAYQAFHSKFNLTRRMVGRPGGRILSEDELSRLMGPPWLKNFDNRFFVREAMDELAFARQKLPASDEAKTQLIALKINNWTMPCYELNATNVPVPVNTTDKFDVNVKKSWVLFPMCIVETVFLGYDQRFGRRDQGDVLKVFETVVRLYTDEEYCTSRTFHAATYDEALRMHDHVHEQAEMGNIVEYFPHRVEVE